MAEQQTGAMASMATQQKRINIVALGRTGEGKSAFLNNILRYCGQRNQKFEEKAAAFSVTKEIDEKNTLMSDGRAIRLIDTIGLFDTENTVGKRQWALIAQAAGTKDEDHQIVLMKLMQIIQLCPDGIHAFLIVAGIGRITIELQETFQLIIDYFGKHVLQYCIFVFTKIDMAPEYPHEVVRQWVEKCLQRQGFMGSIEDQCVFLSNREKDEMKVKQTMQTLFNAIDQNLLQNGGQPYVNPFQEEAQKQMKEQKSQIRAEVEAKYAKDMYEKLKPIQENHTKHVFSILEEMVKRVINGFKGEPSTETILHGLQDVGLNSLVDLPQRHKTDAPSCNYSTLEHCRGCISKPIALHTTTFSGLLQEKELITMEKRIEIEQKYLSEYERVVHYLDYVITCHEESSVMPVLEQFFYHVKLGHIWEKYFGNGAAEK